MDQKNSKVHSFRDLRVWQAGMDLVEHVYRLTQAFPPQEMYGLTIQMRRAAVSIPSNIAEGHIRAHSKEFLNFISIAHGSLAELQTQIEIAGRLRYLSALQVTPLLEQAASLSKQLHTLRSAISKRD
ncbi:MAG: four helix bundle protein [Deltaproteobacteria bacterium]|nr:four helix bundle protein [Deltaproteobacteria bacterium]